MPNKYENEIFKARTIRDKAIINEITTSYDSIRVKTLDIIRIMTDKANGNDNYFSDRAGRAEKFAIDLNKGLRPEYLKKDYVMKNMYAEDYRTAYFESLYTITNEGIAEGYLVKLPRYTKKQFDKAINSPLSKLSNSAKMKTGRSVDIEQLYSTIVSGVESGLSLPNINRAIDINLGFRATDGKWIEDKALRKGQQYRTQRILRTEVLRMRATAETDQWLNQQPIVPSKMQIISVLDNRTRAQSAQIDGQIANREGKFLYPDGQYHFSHNSGVAKWDINDRETTITVDEEFPPESRIQRDPNTGKNEVVPFQNFEEYAKSKGLVKNRYGEMLFK